MLSGWGICGGVACKSYRPEKRRDVLAILAEHEGSLLARGQGRSYGDASLQPAGTVRTTRLDHVISFDESQGILRAQAGMTLADVMALFIPRGWFPPVIPGTRHISLGGAFACNVHGKNHFRDGDFAEHVLSISLLLADGSTVVCSPEQNADLFWATAGGMGMTGIIEELTLKLRPVTSCSLRSVTSRIANIEEMVAAFEAAKNTADYMIGWLDHMATGANIGKGLFSAANHIYPADGGQPLSDFKAPQTKLSVPIFFPPFVLNRYSMAVHNWLRFQQYKHAQKTETVNFDGFFHPLDAIANWNKLYGKRGFYQYQLMIPDSPNAAALMREFLGSLQEQKQFSFLGVIKYHRESKGLMTFSTRGYSIALDFPNTERVRALLPQMDAWVAKHGGRVYLAKDALLSAEHFRQMYPSADAWLSTVQKYDPQNRFTSLMSERLKWKQN
ncbi:MAG: FAD-binding oxidoreductase [Alphaproteobacteria bacterium]|nr:FAD-binding oxidoreductase [Alphaproteobacteria bacterium]